MTFHGSSTSSKAAPMQIWRIGPTLWVNSNQLASVSNDEPLLPIRTNYHGQAEVCVIWVLFKNLNLSDVIR